MRLEGMDAPEGRENCWRRLGGRLNGWKCGSPATEEMRKMVEGKTVRCEPKYCDPYGRTVAVCWLDGKDIGEGMVDAGWAIDWPYYSSGRYRVMQRIRANTGEVFGKMADYQAFGCSVAW